MQTNTKNSKDLLRKLTTKQRRSLPLLVAGMSGVEVAREVNVNPATLSQWKHDPDFAEALDLYRWEAMRTAQDHLCSLANESVAQLEKLLRDARSEQIKLKAIELVLNTLGFSNSNRGFVPEPERVSGGQYDLNKIIDGMGLL